MASRKTANVRSSGVWRKRNPVVWTLAVLIGAWLAQLAGFDLSSLLEAGTSAPVAVEAPSSLSRDSGAEAPSSLSRDSGAEAPSSLSRDSGADRIARAFEARESGFMVTVDAQVTRLLRDDLDGSRHQRFLIDLPLASDSDSEARRTLLVAHNIDLAERVDLEVGDRLRVRGQYEWNDRGGVLHWTHHDPDGSHPGGWIEIGGHRVD
jgi:hypothetical protein